MAAGAAVFVLVPLILATWAFGRAYRQSEIGRTDAGLVAGAEIARNDINAASSEAAAYVDRAARSKAVQTALIAGRSLPPRNVPTAHGLLHVTLTPGASAPSGLHGVGRTAVVTRGGAVAGTIVARVDVAAVVRDAVRNAPFRTLVLPSTDAPVGHPVGHPVTTRLRGERVRALIDPVGDRAIALAVPYSSIERAVRHRELLTVGAGVSTFTALAAIVILLPGTVRLRRRATHGSDAHRRRSAVALVGDVAVAAHDPHALLPVLLETAVVATDAVGGRVVWKGAEIAAIGEPVGQEVVLSLDDDDGAARLVVFPGPEGLTARDAEILESLVAQGRVALENARLHGIVRRQALTDELTDLANRRRFMEALHHEVARGRRFESPVSLVIFDLDRFKRINDEHGHQVGDRVLQEAADVIRARVRETDLAARIGGEEFAVILVETDADGAVTFAHQLRRDIETNVRVDGLDDAVTASFGVATAVAASTAETLIATADRALYRAKADGRNTVRSGA
jgi:diguanylate cyclase (GGDEF)-like protein